MASKLRQFFTKQGTQSSSSQHSQQDHDNAASITANSSICTVSGNSEEDDITPPESPKSPGAVLDFDTSTMSRDELIKALEDTTVARDDAVQKLITMSRYEQRLANSVASENTEDVYSLKLELGNWKETSLRILEQLKVDTKDLDLETMQPRHLERLRHAPRIMNLERELEQAQEKVATLETQLDNCGETINSLKKENHSLRTLNTSLRNDISSLRTMAVRQSKKPTQTMRQERERAYSSVADDTSKYSATLPEYRRNLVEERPRQASNASYWSELPDVPVASKHEFEQGLTSLNVPRELDNEESQARPVGRRLSSPPAVKLPTKSVFPCDITGSQESTKQDNESIDHESISPPIDGNEFRYRASFEGRESLEVSLDEWAQFNSAVATRMQTDTGCEETCHTKLAPAAASVSRRLSAPPPPQPSNRTHRRVASETVYLRESDLGGNMHLDHMEQIAETATAETTGPEQENSESSKENRGEIPISRVPTGRRWSQSNAYTGIKFESNDNVANDNDIMRRIFSKIPLFDSLDRTEQTILSDRFEMRRYADQDLVFGPSGKQGNFFVVLEGCVIALAPLRKEMSLKTGETQTIRFCRGDYFLGDEIKDHTAVAKGHTCCLVLSAEALTEVLEWFANARKMVDMAEEAHIGSNPQQQAMIEKMRNELKWSTDCRSFKSVIRRYSATLRELPLSADTHDEPCVLYAKLQQSKRDLVREECILVNGTNYQLGSEKRLHDFLTELKNIVAEKTSHMINVEYVGQAVGSSSNDLDTIVDHILNCLVDTITIVASRTNSGGDSYDHCVRLFGTNENVSITADSTSSAPTDIVVQEGYIQIQSENLYRVLWFDSQSRTPDQPDELEHSTLCGLLRAVDVEKMILTSTLDWFSTTFDHRFCQNTAGARLFATKDAADQENKPGNDRSRSMKDRRAHFKANKRNFLTTLLSRRRSKKPKVPENIDKETLRRIETQEEWFKQVVHEDIERCLRVSCRPVD